MKIDNAHVRASQIARLEQIRGSRDTNAVNAALEAITQAARDGKANLLELAVVASKARATVGEISYAIEIVAGRHVATDSIVRGAYSKESLENTNE